MFKISPLTDLQLGEFKRLFCYYYAELGCTDNCAELLEDYILPDLLSGLIKIEILETEGRHAGFVIYQKDDIDNDWNLKEGWGDIREIYVEPRYRRQGLGRFLLYTAELKLRESGVNRAYCLPAEGSESFFAACGYQKTEEYNGDLDCLVYQKASLVNGCNKKA